MSATDAEIVDAARRYAAAVVAHEGAGAGRIALEALLEREAAEHDLIVAVGMPCPYCDPLELCPGARHFATVLDMPPL